MQDPEKLLVLERAHILLADVDKAANQIKGGQYTELRTQLFKTGLSIVSNTTEGREKDGDREFLRFLNMAMGSAGELKTQLRVAGDCGLIPEKEIASLRAKASEVGRMLNGLIQKIKKDLGQD